jgi:hypothetical protein
MTADPGARPAAPPEPTWTWGGYGVLIFPPDSGVPDVPLRWALRSAGQSSAIGLVVGAVALTAAIAVGWGDEALPFALGAIGVPTVKAGHRLAVMVGSVVAAVPCVLILWAAAERWPAGPWGGFIGFGLTLAISSQAGTAAAYLRRGGSRAGRERHR